MRVVRDTATPGLQKLARQLPFATAVALTRSAQDVKAAEERQIRDKIDRPTPFTQRGLYLRRATKRRLVAVVGIKPVQAGYLGRQIEGGTRRPDGAAIVVPNKVRLNKYGNIPRGSVKRAAGKPATFVAGARHRRTTHLPAGVYQRIGRKKRDLKLLAAFERSTFYARRLPFGKTAPVVVRSRFGGHLRGALRAAMATAR